jgi:hypothetical protein
MPIQATGGGGGAMTQQQLFAEKKRLAAEKKKKKEDKAKAEKAAADFKAANPQIAEAAKPPSDCKCSACGLGLPCVKVAGTGAVTFQGRF